MVQWIPTLLREWYPSEPMWEAAAGKWSKRVVCEMIPEHAEILQTIQRGRLQRGCRSGSVGAKINSWWGTFSNRASPDTCPPLLRWGKPCQSGEEGAGLRTRQCDQSGWLFSPNHTQMSPSPPSDPPGATSASGHNKSQLHIRAGAAPRRRQRPWQKQQLGGTLGAHHLG